MYITFYVTEFSPGSFPFPTKLHLYIFSTVVGLPFLPVCSLVWAVSTVTIPCWFWQQNGKTFSYGGQEQEQLINTAPPQLPELSHHKFPLLTSDKQQSF